MAVKDLWRCSPESDGPTNQWASLWLAPENWPFTATEAVERLNATLEALCSEFRFIPNPLTSSETYVQMKMRDHAQALAVSLLGTIVTQILLAEKSAG